MYEYLSGRFYEDAQDYIISEQPWDFDKMLDLEDGDFLMYENVFNMVDINDLSTKVNIYIEGLINEL